MTRDGTVYDYVGGLGDLEARRVRFIGEARARIEEDYLRILRFFRFHAAYGHGHPDAEGLHACIVARDGLSRLSRERVRMETIKLLVAARAAPTLAAMAEAGLLIPVIGGVPNLAGFENVAKAEAAAGLKADATRRLGGLAVIIAEDAERLWQRLRLTNNEHARLTAMAELAASFARDGRGGGARDTLRAPTRTFSSTAPSSPGRARRKARTMPPGATWSRCRNARRGAGISAQGQGLPGARRRARARARRGIACRGGSLDRGGISAGRRSARENGRLCA